MGWVGRLFDARDTWARMLLLDLSGVGYLVFRPNEDGPVSGTQWVLAVIAFACALALHKRPVVNLGAQTALLAVSFVLIDDQMINQVGAGWALLEVAMWARALSTLWWGVALVAAVYAVHAVTDPPERMLAGVFGLGVVIGLPVLLGLVIRTTRELGRQAEQKAAEEQRRRESEDRAARAGERAAIARELHDVVAHHVASMVLRVGVARHVLPDLDPRVGEVFDDVHGAGSTALADLRRLVAVLRDPEGVRGDAALTAIEPSALPAALDGAVETARRSGLVVDADIDAAAGSLDAVRGLAVLRLTQEALTNVAKHAGPAVRVHLRVGVTGDDVTWEVTDDGGGTRPGPLSGPVPGSAPGPLAGSLPGSLPGGGHGLTGMRERVEVLGGELAAGPWANGWRVRTVLPGSEVVPTAAGAPGLPSSGDSPGAADPAAAGGSPGVGGAAGGTA